MFPTSMVRFVLRRSVSAWKLLLSVLVGITIAATMGIGTPLFLSSLEQLAFGVAVEKVAPETLSFRVLGEDVPLTRESIEYHEETLSRLIEDHLADFYLDDSTYFRGDTFIVGHPGRPLPKQRSGTVQVSRGYLQYLSGLEEHSRLVRGRVAVPTITDGKWGPIVEGVVSATTAEEFGLAPGDFLVFTASVRTSRWITLRVVGVVEAVDVTSEFWGALSVILAPAPLEESVLPGHRVDRQEPPIAVFLPIDPMVEVVDRAYPGIEVKVDPIWSVIVSTDNIKKIPFESVAARLGDFRRDTARVFRDATVTTALLDGLIDGLRRRAFFARIPLIVLMIVMLATVLLNVATMVVHLSGERGTSAALLRSRGITTWRLLRLDAIEALTMAVLAVSIAPVLAVGTVALVGKLPFFSESTRGSLLSVEPTFTSLGVGAFIAAASVGVFLLPVLAKRGRSLAAGKAGISRPTVTPFFYRHYLDLGALAVGVVVFAEFQSRGQIVSGGLFRELEINEALVVGPLLLAIAIALMFMRIFPLLARFVVGDSTEIVHLLVGASVTVICVGLVVLGVREAAIGEAADLVAIVIATGIAYWLTTTAKRVPTRALGIVTQAALIAVFFFARPLDTDGPLILPMIGLLSVVPAQILSHVFRRWSRSVTAWVMLGLWQMSRNSMKYTMLGILLALVVALGVLSTTVGGTLERSEIESIRFEVPTDVRVVGNPQFKAGGLRTVKDEYRHATGVAAAALAYPTTGLWGPNQVHVLAEEPEEYAYTSWFRSVFADASLPELMSALTTGRRSGRTRIPDGASRVGLWVNPIESFPAMSVWVSLRDGAGKTQVLNLGQLEKTGWQQFVAEIPADLQRPLFLASIQLYQPLAVSFGGGLGNPGGTVVVDEVTAWLQESDEIVILDDFEESFSWSPILTSVVNPDQLRQSSKETHHGSKAARFTFGKATIKGVRGLTTPEAGAPVPVIVSQSIADAGIRQGQVLAIRMDEVLTPVVVRGVAHGFPTIDPGGAFVVADVNRLLAYLNTFGQVSRIDTNELFIGLTEPSSYRAEEITSGLRSLRVQVKDGVSQLASLRKDPLVSGGWRTMLLLALVITLTSTFFGYFSYTLAQAARLKSEGGVLRSLGFTRRQMLGLLGLEHGTIVTIGVVLGTWMGLQMSRQLISALAVDEAGEAIVPHFVMSTDWGLMAVVYGSVMVAFISSLVILDQLLTRTDLAELSRLEV